MRAITFTQPYGSAVLTDKDVENRPVAPRCIAIGERFAVHAGLKVDTTDSWGLAKQLGNLPANLPTGAIVGTVELVGWVRTVPGQTERMVEALGLSEAQIEAVLASRWRHQDSQCLWLLGAPRVLATPIPFKGSQGIWKVPADIEAQIFAQEQG